MKVAAVSMIKDESDIIESFIRINARWADHFFILDNGSSDNTSRILGHLAQEGFPITVTRDSDIDYPQERKTTELVNRVAERREFTFIFPIDGDEFISDAELFRQSLSIIGHRQVGSVAWSGLVPNSSSMMQRGVPLFDGFGQRQVEHRIDRKIVIPNDIALQATIGMGNHFALDSEGQLLPDVALPVPLYHVPVRSEGQIIAKAIIGSNKLSVKEGRDPAQGFHWDLVAETIRANGYRLSDQQLREIALSYGWPAGDYSQVDVVPISIGPPGLILKYPELSVVNVPLLLDGFVRQLCEEIVASRPKPSAAKVLYRKIIRVVRERRLPHARLGFRAPR